MTDTSITSADVDQQAMLNSFESRLSESKTDSTVESYTRHARDYVDWLDNSEQISLFDIRSEEVKDHLRAVDREGYSPSYLGLRRSAIRSLYDELQGIAESRTTEGLDDVDPDEIPPNPAHPDRLTLDFETMEHGTVQEQAAREDYVAVDAGDVKKMLENVPPSHVGGRDHRLLIKLLWYTGLRVSEAVRIKLTDFEDPETFRGNQGERRIRVRAIKTKTNRAVYYPPELAEDLDRWVNGTDRDFVLGERDSSVYLFPSPSLSAEDPDDHVHGRSVNDVVRQAAQGAGIQEPLYEDKNGNTQWKITAHSLRHGFAEASLENGQDLRTLAELLGHFTEDGRPNVDTTTKYLRGVNTAERYRKHSPPSVGRE